MNRRSQQIWVWGGVGSLVSFLVGWVGCMHFLPVPAPSASAAQIAHMFDAHKTGIRFGAIFMIMGTAVEIPWAAVLAARTRKTERDSPVNAWTQVAACAAAAAIIIVAMLVWVVAAFRPTRAPDITLALSDAGFIIAIMPFMIFVIWNVALAFAIFGDDRPTPAFPRWSAYFSLWCAFLYIPGGALAFFHDGPFAWNGALAFYVPAAAFFIWIIVMTVLALRSIARDGDSRAALT